MLVVVDREDEGWVVVDELADLVLDPEVVEGSAVEFGAAVTVSVTVVVSSIVVGPSEPELSEPVGRREMVGCDEGGVSFSTMATIPPTPAAPIMPVIRRRLRNSRLSNLLWHHGSGSGRLCFLW